MLHSAKVIGYKIDMTKKFAAGCVILDGDLEDTR
jgi:hypothetical protein